MWQLMEDLMEDQPEASGGSQQGPHHNVNNMDKVATRSLRMAPSSGRKRHKKNWENNIIGNFMPYS